MMADAAQLGLDFLRDKRIPATFIVMIAFGVWWTHNWAMNTFLTETEGQAIKSSVEHNSQLIVELRSELRLKNAQHRTQELEQSLWDIEQRLKDNGETPDLLRRRQEIKQRYEASRDYYQCLIRQQANCEHLPDGD